MNDGIGAMRGRGHARSRIRVRAFAATLAAGLWAVAACRTAPPQTAAADEALLAASEPSRADEPNTTHGIYTEEQATRGLEAFREICSECHETKDWTDPAFLDRWEEASVYRLWYWIYERMPHGQPGTLSRQQVTDALTYILQLNGLPPGETELATDDDTIDDYWIIWKKVQ